MDIDKVKADLGSAVSEQRGHLPDLFVSHSEFQNQDTIKAFGNRKIKA